MLSDFVWGNYRTEMVSTVLWSLGSIFVLLTTIPAFTHLGGSGGVGFLTFIPVFLGIFLTASGYGMINPIQSVFVADQFKAGQEPAMVRSFAWVRGVVRVRGASAWCVCGERVLGGGGSGSMKGTFWVWRVCELVSERARPTWGSQTWGSR